MILLQSLSACCIALVLSKSSSVQLCCLADSFLCMSFLIHSACKPGLASLKAFHAAQTIRGRLS